MDFEKIVDAVPIGVAAWRSDTDLRADKADFRLIYTNIQASKEAGVDMSEFLGMSLKQINAKLYGLYPISEDIWLRVLVSNKPEIINKKCGTKYFDSLIVPVDTRTVATMFTEVTADRKVQRSLATLRKVELDLLQLQKKRSGEYKL